jgi:hypothetical protein
MTERPIIFSAPMVRALLEGRKTQTRRILKPQPDTKGRGFLDSRLPYARGDRLWVREAWAPLESLTHGDPGPQALADRGFYRADNSTVDGEISRWRSPIHMPRWASRITLAVTEVRVQRLQEISEADAVAEGCREGYVTIEGINEGWSARTAFRDLWNQIHGPAAWDANPWVCAISFEVHRHNIDRIAA